MLAVIDRAVMRMLATLLFFGIWANSAFASAFLRVGYAGEK
jgi:hypothetical protein